MTIPIPTLLEVPQYAKSQVLGHRPDLRHRHSTSSKWPNSNRYPIQSGSTPEPTVPFDLHSCKTPNGPKFGTKGRCAGSVEIGILACCFELVVGGSDNQ